MPAGLEISSSRKFRWSLVTIAPGLLGITNETTATPTIQFDPLIFSGVSIKIRCSIVGQPRNFKDYILYTVINEQSYVGFQSVINVTNSQYYDITNLNVVATQSSFITGTGPFSLEWGPTAYPGKQSYLVEIWNDGWQFLTQTSNYIIPVTNPLTSYRVKAIFTNSEIKSNFVTYGVSYKDEYYLTVEKSASKVYLSNNIIGYQQINSSSTFFVGIEQDSRIDNILSKLYIENNVVGYTQVNNTLSFFTSIETLSMQESVLSKLYTTNLILGYTQLPNPNLFFTELIGS
jgi:hypothetical protein